MPFRLRTLTAALLATCSLAMPGCQSPGAGAPEASGQVPEGGPDRGSICTKPRSEPLGPSGGRFVIGTDESPALGGLALQVPAGALNGAVTVMVTCGDELAGPDEVALSASARLLPDTQTFITPVTLTLPLLSTTPPDGAEVAVAIRSAGQTTYLTGAELHSGPSPDTLNLDVSRFGDFEVVARKPHNGPPTKNLDVLVVMDNSPSITPKQKALARQIPLLLRRLDALGLDYHLGMVSTDIGTNVDAMTRWGGNVGSCDTFAGDDGVLQSVACTERTNTTSDARNDCNTLCPDNRFVPLDGKRYISKISGITNVPSDLVLDPMSGMMVDMGPARAFQCMALVGDAGCGVESPLEAAKRALDGHRAENSGFLRSDSLLVVLFLTDEDDCSVQLLRRSENNPAVMDCPTPDANAPAGCFNLDYRCLARSVVCDQPMNTAGPKTHCTERPNNYLEPIGNYARFFRTLRPANRLLIGGIWTLPSIDQGGQLIVERGGGGTSTPFLNRGSGASASCSYSGSPGIIGQAQLRLSTFAASFPDAQQYSVCDLDNFGRSVDEIARAIGEKIKK